MQELLEAIALKVADTPALTQGLKGGMSLDHASPGAPMPYGTFQVISAPQEYDTEDSRVQPVTIQFDLWAATFESIRTLAATWKDAFDQEPLPITNGALLMAEVRNELFSYEAAGGSELLAAWRYLLEIEFTTEH